MPLLDCSSLKKWLPLLVFLLVVAQIDLASAFGWPIALLSLLHLTPQHDDMCRGMCAGIGTILDLLVLLQLARLWAKNAIEADGDPQRD